MIETLTSLKNSGQSVIGENRSQNDLQRTGEWYSSRLGKVTASRIKDVIEKTKGSKNKKPEYTAKRHKYMMELIAEQETGIPTDSYVDRRMRWGMEQEPFAKKFYEDLTGQRLINVGFIQHPLFIFSGGSPDFCLYENSGGEIKCPETVTHLSYWMTGDISEHLPQCHWNMDCTESDTWVFLSFDPRMKNDNKKLYCQQIGRDQNYINSLREEVELFWEDLLKLKKDFE